MEAETNGSGRTRREIRNAYLVANAFELFAALLALVACTSYLVEPQNLSDGSIGHIQFPDLFWNGMYGLGAALVIAGLALISPRVEVVGLCLFGSAVAIQAIAVGDFRGWSGAAAVAIYAGFAGASGLRAWVLVQAVLLYRHETDRGEHPGARVPE